MIDPALGEVLRGAIGGVLALPIFWLSYPLMLLWIRWSHAWMPTWLPGLLWIIEIIALGLLVIGGSGAIAAHLAGMLGIPGMPYDAAHYHPGMRIWPADVLLYVAGLIPALAIVARMTRLRVFRRPRATWLRWVEHLSR